MVGGRAAMIELDNLVVGYEGRAITPALSGMIHKGSMTAIVGLNGCGKSTLLKTLAGFIPPVSGVMRWTPSRPTIGWLAQRHALESQFPLTVIDVVSQGAWPRISLLRGIGRDVRRRIQAALIEVVHMLEGEDFPASAILTSGSIPSQSAPPPPNAAPMAQQGGDDEIRHRHPQDPGDPRG